MSLSNIISLAFKIALGTVLTAAIAIGISKSQSNPKPETNGNTSKVEPKEDTQSSAINQSTASDDSTKLLKEFYNHRFNTTILYPRKWKMEGLPQNGDGFEVKDTNGSGKILFYGSFAFKDFDGYTYEPEDWEEFSKTIKVDSGCVKIAKIPDYFYYKSGKDKLPLRSMLFSYNCQQEYTLQKITLTNHHSLNLFVSCDVADTEKYKALFDEIMEEVVIEEGGIYGERK
jgi:hypothetical protein